MHTHEDTAFLLCPEFFFFLIDLILLIFRTKGKTNLFLSLGIISPERPLFNNILSNFSFFKKSKCWSKMCQILYSAWKISQNVSNRPAHHLTPFSGLLTKWPLSWRKISHWKTPSFKLLSERPYHFQLECSPLPPAVIPTLSVYELPHDWYLPGWICLR